MTISVSTPEIRIAPTEAIQTPLRISGPMPRPKASGNKEN
jgi:hypothetical protein